MQSKYINGTINKDIYIHNDSGLESRVDDLESEIQTKQDELTAGENIAISSSNVISASGGATVFTGVLADASEDPRTFTLDDSKTVQDIYEAFLSNNDVILTDGSNAFRVDIADEVSDTYLVSATASGLATYERLSIKSRSTSNPNNPYVSGDTVILYYSITNLVNSNRIVTSISSENTNSQIPSALAVYNAISTVSDTEIVEYGSKTAEEICALLDDNKNVIVTHNGLLYNLHSLYGSDTYKSSVVDYGIQSDIDLPFMTYHVSGISESYSTLRIKLDFSLDKSWIDNDLGCYYNEIGVWLVQNTGSNTFDTLYEAVDGQDPQTTIISPYNETLSSSSYIDCDITNLQQDFYIVLGLITNRSEEQGNYHYVGGITLYTNIDNSWVEYVSVTPAAASSDVALYSMISRVNHQSLPDGWCTDSSEYYLNITLDPDIQTENNNLTQYLSPSDADVQNKWVKFSQTNIESSGANGVISNISVAYEGWTFTETPIKDLVPIPSIPVVTTFTVTYDEGTDSFIIDDNKTVYDIYSAVLAGDDVYINTSSLASISKFHVNEANRSQSGLPITYTYSVSASHVYATSSSSITLYCLYARRVNAESTTLYLSQQTLSSGT